MTRVSLGSGLRAPHGWMATDLYPEAPEVMALDLRAPLPFESRSVEFFHAEHVIEHLEYVEIERLLDEAHRCLAPGGVLRIATPDAMLFLDLPRVLAAGGPVAEQWEEWVITANQRWGVDPQHERAWLFAVNRAFNWWGHRFLLTRPFLDQTLRRHRFQPEWQCVGESRFSDLRGIERHGEVGGGMQNALQTMVVDAVKPSQVARSTSTTTGGRASSTVSIRW